MISPNEGNRDRYSLVSLGVDFPSKAREINYQNGNSFIPVKRLKQFS